MSIASVARLVRIVALLLISHIVAGQGVARGAEYSGAVGTLLGWSVRQEYASRSFYQFAPEVFAYMYLPISGPFWIRPGVRFGYRWMQPDMPQAFRIEQLDAVVAGDVAVLWEWNLVFSLGVGGQLVARSSRFITAAPVEVASDPIGGTRWLKDGYVQAGVGVPAAGGLVVLEPVLRWMFLAEDWREKFLFGIEASLGF